MLRPHSGAGEEQRPRGGPTKAVYLAALVIVLLALLWFCRRALLLTFSGLLLALIITSLINQMRRLFPLGQGVGVALVLLLFGGLGTLTGSLLLPGLIDQFSELSNRLPETTGKLIDEARETSVYKHVAKVAPDLSTFVQSSKGAFSKLTAFFSSTFDTVASVVLVLFVALFLAGNPRVYRRLALKMIPPKHRRDAESILERVLCTLKYWLLGQLISMVVIGLIMGVSFALCGLPLATSLGVLAGIGEFIPFLGPFIAAVPALIIAFSESGKLFLIVLGVYVGIQFAEGHFLMPIVHRRTVNLPPVITLLSLFLMGNAFGLLGMFVAAPLTAVALVLVDELYVQRWLGDEGRLMEEG